MFPDSFANCAFRLLFALEQLSATENKDSLKINRGCYVTGNHEVLRYGRVMRLNGFPACCRLGDFSL